MLIVGPPFSGKTHLMLKIFPGIPNQDIYIVTKSPLEQNYNSKIEIELGKKIKPRCENENTIIVVDDVLGTSNSKYIDQFLIRGRHIF